MRKGLIVLLFYALIRSTILGCGWDWDTIQMEKRQFPSIHELITGKFLRHSQEFYYWRVKDRTEKLQLYPDSLEFYDDLAWAYDKTGEHEKAIETMKKKESLSPGLYENYANMGTSYLHKGDLEEGLKYINKAIEINPEAHFGREVYQKYLVEYMIEKRDSNGNITLPLSIGNEPDFYTFLKKHHFEKAISEGSTREEEIAKAVKGIAGMMKFGQYRSPILLEALGDLLYAAQSGFDPGAGHLGARAYQKAAFETKDSAISELYAQKAVQSIERVWGPEHLHGRREFERHVYPHKNLIAALKVEVLSAENWYERIRQNELDWIKSGINPDSAFAAIYYDEPKQETEYEANSQIFDKVDEQAWLKRQLDRPEEIVTIHYASELPYETKSMLDSIYDQEFRTYFPEDDVAEENNDSEEDEEDNTLNSITLYLLIAIVVVLGLVFAFLRKGSRRK